MAVTIAPVVSATAILWFAAWRAHIQQCGRNSTEAVAESESLNLLPETPASLRGAMSVVLVLSCALMLLATGLWRIQALLLGSTSVAATAALAFSLLPPARALLQALACNRNRVRLPCGMPAVERAVCMLLPACTLLVYVWLKLGGHWLLNDILAAALTTGVLSAFRPRCLRQAVVLVICVTAYDVFWINSSMYILGENVMAASTLAVVYNPAGVPAVAATEAADSRQKPPHRPQSTIGLPNKLLFPDETGYAVLGLGDLAVPGLLLAYVYRADHTLRPSGTKRLCYGVGWLFTAGIFGFAVGLLFTEWAADRSGGQAQPAMMFLAPAVILPVVLSLQLQKVMAAEEPSDAVAAVWNGFEGNESSGKETLPD